MTTDERSLVERLRSRGWNDRQHRKLREEAADEIERLERNQREGWRYAKEVEDEYVKRTGETFGGSKR